MSTRRQSQFFRGHWKCCSTQARPVSGAVTVPKIYTKKKAVDKEHAHKTSGARQETVVCTGSTLVHVDDHEIKNKTFGEKWKLVSMWTRPELQRPSADSCWERRANVYLRGKPGRSGLLCQRQVWISCMCPLWFVTQTEAAWKKKTS